MNVAATLQNRITPRSVLIGGGLIFANAYYIAWMEPIKQAGRTTIFSLFFLSVFLLVVFATLNRVLERRAPRFAFSQTELMVIYVMMNLGIALIGVDQIQVLVPMLAYPIYNATAANRWDELFVPLLPDWLVVTDFETCRAMYEGGRSFWEWDILRHWLVPLGAWSAFIVLMLVGMMGINILLRKQWSDREKLTYPLVNIPLELSTGRPSVYRHQAFWWAFGLVCFINTVNGLHELYPALPEIHTAAHRVKHELLDEPWRAMGQTWLAFYPWAIGLGYLLPLDLLFSSWFFCWFWKGERILSSVFGLTVDRPNAPYVSEQSLGAYLGICVMTLWLARRHVWAVIRRAFGRRDAVDDAGEAFGYLPAFWAVVLAGAGMVWFSLAAGLSLGTTLWFLVVFWGVSITVTRIRAEFGAPVHDLHYADPGTMLTNIVGTTRVAPNDLVGLTLYFWTTRAYRSSPMPFQLESLRIAEKLKVDQSKMTVVLLLAGGLAIAAAFMALLTPYYQLGIGTSKVIGNPMGFSRQGYNRLQSWLTMARGPDVSAGVALVIGGVFTWLLQAVRLRIIGWPFHPVAFAVSSSWNMGLLWMPLLLAWVAKFLTFRYGGPQMFRKCLPFFYGLLLGDFASTAIWNGLCVAFGWPGYRLFYA